MKLLAQCRKCLLLNGDDDMWWCVAAAKEEQQERERARDDGGGHVFACLHFSQQKSRQCGNEIL